jgi:hypothetical protein
LKSINGERVQANLEWKENLMAEVKQWQCGNGHVLGQVKRNGRGIRQLLLYRHAVDMTAESPEQVDIIGEIEGTVLRIRCDVAGCEEIRTWEIDKEAAQRVIQMYAAE